MNIVVQGLWHLGTVTAACCARHFDVTGIDFDDKAIAGLQQGRAPLAEPGLNELVSNGIARRQLRFTIDPERACREADLLWLCYDTPVDENDTSDVSFVLSQFRQCAPHLRPGTLVLISSQVPVGTCAALEAEFPSLQFAYSPENLRLGKALESFEKAERVIVGIRDDRPRELLQKLFAPFTNRVLFMRTESAEMVKHALNAFLALSITFINEIARVSESVGADAAEVSAGLKSEPRIGPRAYLSPGGPFAGGTLARDVVTLSNIGDRLGEKLRLIPAIKASNDEHRAWALRHLRHELGSVSGKTVAVLGLVYTPGTDTLRRSAAVELCRALLQEGARVTAFDPAVTVLPSDMSQVALFANMAQAVHGADAAVICTEWPIFRDAPWSELIPTMRRPLIIDANRFLEKPLQATSGIQHIVVGRS